MPTLDSSNRWAPALGRYPRHGNIIRPLLDGTTAFQAIYDAIQTTKGSSHFIYMLAWWLDDDLRLSPGVPDSTLRALLEEKAKAGVQVRVMMWLQPFKRLGGDDTPEQIKRLFDVQTDPTAWVKQVESAIESFGRGDSQSHFEIAKRINALPGAAAIVDWLTASLYGSHHQKLLCVRGEKGVIGLCGGVDVNPDRVKVVSPNKGQPLHDVHCEVRGPAAADLVAGFVQRWDLHPDSAVMEKRGKLLGREVLANDDPNAKGHVVRVVTTYNEVHGSKFSRNRDACKKERSVKDALLKAIQRATRFIYFEDQYMVSLIVADALASVLPRLQHVTALITHPTICDLPQVWRRRKEFIERATRNGSLKNFFAYYLFDSKMNRFGEYTYVHSKSWIFDDELVYIGSANINNRGFSSDTEIGMIAYDAPSSAKPPYNLAQTIRMRLWQKHLGAVVLDPIGEQSRNAWNNQSEPSRVRPYDANEATDSAKYQLLPWDIVDPDAESLLDCSYRVQQPR